MPGIEEVAGAVTAVTGFEKGSGKTTFLNLALPYARVGGPVAIFTIGVDGAHKARETSAPGGELRVEPGDVVLTTEAFARASDARFEVLEAIPGRTSLGQLLLGRAVRPGSVTLVGPEHLSTLAQLIQRVREEGWVRSVLVDGAVNRLTQVSALGPMQFVFTVRVDPANLERVAERLKSLEALATLPQAPAQGLELHGPVTPAELKALPEGAAAFSAEDFTKFFLEPDELLRTLTRYQVTLRRRFPLLGFAVTLRNLERAEFLRAVGAQAGARVLFNPFEVAS